MGTAYKVPFLDLTGLHAGLEEELVAVFRHALKTSGFVGGTEVEQFEAEFAQFCEADYCVGVNSGTDALRFALMAAGVARGDVVITVPNTFIATAEAISQAGALPRFVDVDEKTYNMDAERLTDYLERGCIPDHGNGRLVDKETGKVVKAIVPVHLYGQPADMDSILEVAERYGLLVIEDACQAHGAGYFSRREGRWMKAGSMGTAAAFSFYPGKNLGACGEGGAVTTNDAELAQKVRMLRDHGQAKKYYHEMEGYNGRLDAVQAGILRTKLRHLPEWNRARRESAARYNELFTSAGTECLVPFEPAYSQGVYHLYVIRVPDREGLRGALARSQIGTGIHYPVALHLQRAYEHLGYSKGDFPVTEKVAGEILSLPMFPQLGLEEQAYVIDQVHCFFSKAVGIGPMQQRGLAVPYR